MRSPDDLVGLVPLAGDEHDVAGGGLEHRALRWRRGGPARRSPRARPPAKPGRMASAIACGSSLRGLSLVTMATSASRPTASPMSGRFRGSRSPPQPKTQTCSSVRRPGSAREPPHAGEHARQRVGGVRVVDEDHHVVRARLVAALEPAGDGDGRRERPRGDGEVEVEEEDDGERREQVFARCAHRAAASGSTPGPPACAPRARCRPGCATSAMRRDLGVVGAGAELGREAAQGRRSASPRARAGARARGRRRRRR